VVGKNGKGKTTLLKLLAGHLTPHSGEIVCSPNITRGVFEQTNIKSLMGTRTVEEEILYSHQDVDRQTARNICGTMMFSGDDALKKISILSGGEKNRVMLGKLMVTPVNLLLLDEPTNHLDMDACEALLAAIDNFNGTVIMVTHNEMFLHALAQKLIVFQADQLEVFHGGYQEFLEKGGWKDEDRSGKPDRIENSVKHRAGRPNRKDMRKKRSGIIIEKGKTLKPMKDRMLQVEEEIERSETEIAQINKDLASASLPGNGSRIADLSRQLNTRQAAIDSLYDEFETLTTGLEKKQAEFEKQLTDLEAMA
jgi:ATP-binding cassette subfamily F protein 3